MSAPRTDLEKQAKRHIGPLVGMVVAVLFGVGVIVYCLFDEVDSASNPQGNEPAAEGSVGPADEGSLPTQTDDLAPPATTAPPAIPAPANP